MSSSALASDEQIESRLSNPMNLMNRLSTIRESAGKRQSAMGLFGINRSTSEGSPKSPAPSKDTVEQVKTVEQLPTFNNPFTKLETSTALIPANTQTISLPQTAPITTEHVLEESHAKIKLGLAHDNAISLLSESITRLRTDLERVDIEKLPAVINAAGKVVESIRRERNEVAKTGRDKEVHYHFYTPTQKKLEDYEVIDV